MNLFILKYGILIVSLLTTTAFVSSTLNPLSAQSNDVNGTVIDSQSVFAFGSQVFYREVSKPGNEYMQSGVEGYSQDLVPTDAEDKNYTASWQAGVAKFESGYNRCIYALVTHTSASAVQTPEEKTTVCEKFRAGENEMIQAKNDFLAARASASPATDSGFTIAMVLERVDEIIQSSDDADQACMKEVLAENNPDYADFSSNRKDIESAVQEMKRIYPELQVLSSDFT
jgi:predicted secreted protein